MVVRLLLALLFASSAFAATGGNTLAPDGNGRQVSPDQKLCMRFVTDGIGGITDSMYVWLRDNSNGSDSVWFYIVDTLASGLPGCKIDSALAHVIVNNNSSGGFTKYGAELVSNALAPNAAYYAAIYNRSATHCQVARAGATVNIYVNTDAREMETCWGSPGTVTMAEPCIYITYHPIAGGSGSGPRVMIRK